MKFFSSLAAFCLLSTVCVQKSYSQPILSTSNGAEIIITEILADPDPVVGLPEAEFVELYNRSSAPINLNGWILFDGSSRQLPAIVLLPDSFVIICSTTNSSLLSAFGTCAAVSSLSLTNTGEKIALRNPLGYPVDSVTYSDSWYGSSFKKDGGWSLERIDNFFDCAIASNWAPSEALAGGTPGLPNSIAGTITDDQPPLLIRAWCPDSSGVILVFNEPLASDAVGNLASFNCPGLQIDSVFFTDQALNTIQVVFPTPFAGGTIYTITVNNITDCAGNSIAANTSERFGIADSIREQMITFNEVLFNPYENGYDFIELFHLGNQITDLQFLDLLQIDPETGVVESSTKITDESFLFFPGDYMVITENPLAVANQYQSSFPKYFLTLNDMPSMNIDEGHIRLMAYGNLIDDFKYDDKMHFELLTDQKGISLEKINPSRSSVDRNSWHSASPLTGGATPGLQNSQFSKIGNSDMDVSVHPEIFSPDQDGYNDVIQFSVAPGKSGTLSTIKIFNERGQEIYETNGNELLASQSVFSWDGIMKNKERAPVGIYVALVQLFRLDGTVNYFKLPFVLALKI
jgi:hypothetical protein